MHFWTLFSSYRLHHPSDPKLEKSSQPPHLFYIYNPTLLDSVVAKKALPKSSAATEKMQTPLFLQGTLPALWITRGFVSLWVEASHSHYSKHKTFTHPQDKNNKLQAEQPTLYLSQWELPLELLCPDSCWASRRIFSMSPLWMEEEEGTCSKPPFLPLPLSVLLPLPFICSSTQEPAGQPQSPHGHPSTEHTSRLSAAARGEPQCWAQITAPSWELTNTAGTAGTAGTALSFHQHSTPKRWAAAPQLLNQMAPFSSVINSLISHTSPCSLELQLTTAHSITGHPVLLSLLKQNFCAYAP